jgi:hypothetical protein
MPESRTVTFDSGPLTLEGVLNLPDLSPDPSPHTLDPFPGIVVCHPHPQYGGDMRNNVVSAICETAVSNGIAALRFNFRGAGASGGAYDHGSGEQDDVRAALAYLRDAPEVDPGRIALAGYSFGAAVALNAAGGENLRAFVAVSLPTMMPLTEATLACPALFVSGDEDEYSDAEDLTELVGGLGPKAELKLLPGLGHFWFGVEQDLAAILAPFLKTHIAATANV